MRCKEVQRHVSPIVALLRIALKYGHEFDDGNAEVLQVGDFFDQSGIGSSSRGMHTGTGISREALDVKFVNDRVRLRPGREIVRPIECGPWPGQNSKRRFSSIGTWLHRALAIEFRWKINLFRIWIKKNLFLIEAMRSASSVT